MNVVRTAQQTALDVIAVIVIAVIRRRILITVVICVVVVVAAIVRQIIVIGAIADGRCGKTGQMVWRHRAGDAAISRIIIVIITASRAADT